MCTTELGYMTRMKPEFDKRNAKIIGLSVDDVEDHARWFKDIAETQGYAPNYAMIDDTDLTVLNPYGMLPADTEGSCEGRTAATNQTVRTVFVSIAGSVSDDEARKIYPGGWRSPKPHIRFVPQPGLDNVTTQV